MSSLRSTAKALLAIVLILTMQGPAMLMQEIAWARMLATYTQERGIQRGITETFDGQHPCCLCKKAEAIRQAEQKQKPDTPPAPTSKNLLSWGEFKPSETHTASIVPPLGQPIANPAPTSFNRALASCIFSPPVPPPRA